MTATVHALSQLEDYVKDRKYSDTTQSLSVSFVRGFVVQILTPLRPSVGGETNIHFVQTLHFCTTYWSTLETSSGAPRRDTNPLGI